MRLSRKAFVATLLGAPLAGMAGLGYMRLAEPHWLEVTEKRVPIGNLARPLRLLHLSDLHASDVVSYNYLEHAIELALSQRADAALLTGDFITWQLDESARYSSILHRLSDAMPTFACIGNHDGGKWAGKSHGYADFSLVRQMLAEANVDFLFNEKRAVEINGQALSIAGLGDIWSDDAKPDSILSKGQPSAVPTIVLCHNPDAKELLRPFDWDLMLCGHTHGGQLIIPFLGARPFLPVRDKAFAEGLHQWDRRFIHITRGVGNLHGMRFNCRPEISYLQLV